MDENYQISQFAVKRVRTTHQQQNDNKKNERTRIKIKRKRCERCELRDTDAKGSLGPNIQRGRY